MKNNVKLLAFHLPQFHEIEENNKWWGKGFTEWTNVKRGRKMYLGHYQPKVPLGKIYYDLSNPEVLIMPKLNTEGTKLPPGLVKGTDFGSLQGLPLAEDGGCGYLPLPPCCHGNHSRAHP